ncbi:hypothetical protein TorRG33x02_023950 [Trema orientale]|uniref:Uncharacterized protein n=1 Tax=Trema orientale TaxID=63057 RepID=A0A2P5FV04_TREOI|nr:hypothetical protein TorRG33x02_023950 [Trema orientale]
MEVGVTLEFRSPWEAEEEEEAGEAMAHSPEEEFQLLVLEMAEVEPWSNRGLVEVEVAIAMVEVVPCSNAQESEGAGCDRCNLVGKAAEEVEMLDSVHETTAAAAAVCKLASTVAEEEGLSSNVHTTA